MAVLLASSSLASAQCPVASPDSNQYNPDAPGWKHLACSALLVDPNVRHEIHEYGPDPLQRMDIFIPSETQKQRYPKPAVVWIHGGGFWKGTRKNVLSLWPLRQGYIFASISYRLSANPDYPAENPDLNHDNNLSTPPLASPGVQWPTHIRDVRSAIRYLRGRAGHLNLDGKLENHLLAYPGILNAAVVAMPDPMLGRSPWVEKLSRA